MIGPDVGMARRRVMSLAAVSRHWTPLPGITDVSSNSIWVRAPKRGVILAADTPVLQLAVTEIM